MKDEIDLTDLLDAEAELEIALVEWRDAGGPVTGITRSIDKLINAKLEICSARAKDSQHG